MSASSPSEWPIGGNCTVTIVGDTVEKISRSVFSREYAYRLADDTERYAATLREGPLAVAGLRSVRVLPEEDGVAHRVEHTLDLVDGPPILHVKSREKLVHAGSGLLAAVAQMESTTPEGDKLVAPLDSNPDNFHASKSGVVCIDVFPPLNRDSKGRLPVSRLGRRIPVNPVLERRLGSKTGVTTELLLGIGTAMPDDGMPGQALLHDMVPYQLPGKLKDKVHSNIDRRWPHTMARRAERLVWRFGIA